MSSVGLLLKRCAVTVVVLASILITSASSTAEEKAAKGSGPTPIYDEKADGEKLLRDALAKAKKENKRLLIMWGDNLCGWCYKFHDLLEQDAAISKVVSASFVVVNIEAEKRNFAMAKRLNATLEPVPHLTVLDSDGKVLTQQATGAFVVKEDHDPKRVLAWLEKWKPEKPKNEIEKPAKPAS